NLVVRRRPPRRDALRRDRRADAQGQSRGYRIGHAAVSRRDSGSAPRAYAAQDILRRRRSPSLSGDAEGHGVTARRGVGFSVPERLRDLDSRLGACMAAKHVVEIVALMVIGEGVIGVIDPERYLRLWRVGPQPLRELV